MSYTAEEIRAEIERRKRVAAFERQKARGDFNTKYDATEGMSGGQKFAAGMGSSVVDLGKKAVNLALPDVLTPEFASDEAIKQQSKDDADLLNTGAGAAGRFVGDMVVTAPITGGAVGAGAKLLKAAGAASKAARAASGAGRWAGSAPGRAVLEGGLQGAWSSDPENGVGAAAGGALMGAGGNLAGNVLRKTFASGWAKPSRDALRLENWAKGEGQDVFIPLAGRAQDGALKETYRTFVPALPGAKSKLQAELNKAQGQVRQAAGNATTPFTSTPIEGFAHSPQTAFSKLNQAFKDGYDKTLNGYVFRVDSDFDTRLAARLAKEQVAPKKAQAMMDEVRDVIAQHLDDQGNLSGSSVSNIKHELRARFGGGGGGMQRYKALNESVNEIDNLVESQLAGHPGTEADLELIKDLNRKWGAHNNIGKATARAAKEGGAWKPAQAITGTKSELATGSAPLQEQMTRAHKVLGGTVYSPTPAGRVMATGMLLGGAGGGAMMGGLPGAAAGLAGASALGRGLSSPSFQRTLMGNTNVQRKIADALRNKRQMKVGPWKDPLSTLGREGLYELVNGAE